VGRPKLSAYGICKISIACLRQLPNHKSILLSQVLFGEYVEIISKKNKDWFRVKCCWDGLIGWIDPKQFYILKETEKHHYEECDTFALDHLHGLSSDDYTIPISLGSNLYKCDGLNVKMPFGHFKYSGQIIGLKQINRFDKILTTIAKRYIHCPYLFGGRSILGVDGPGLIQVIFKMLGVKLPRTCEGQARMGSDVGFQAQSQVGDIAFFEDGNHVIHHVGLVLEDSMIMHVHGQVRIDRLDQQGIFDQKAKKYTFQLRTIRRIEAIQKVSPQN